MPLRSIQPYNLRLGLPSGRFIFYFRNKTACALRASRCAHVISIDINPPIIFAEKYRSYSIRSFRLSLWQRIYTKHNKGINTWCGRDSPVGIETRLRAERPGFDSRQEQEICVLSITSRPALGLFAQG
jgi:hypothetical protein